MKNSVKRSLSVLLALAMLLSLCPAVFAEDPETAAEQPVQEETTDIFVPELSEPEPVPTEPEPDDTETADETPDEPAADIPEEYSDENPAADDEDVPSKLPDEDEIPEEGEDLSEEDEELQEEPEETEPEKVLVSFLSSQPITVKLYSNGLPVPEFGAMNEPAEENGSSDIFEEVPAAEAVSEIPEEVPAMEAVPEVFEEASVTEAVLEIPEEVPETDAADTTEEAPDEEAPLQLIAVYEVLPGEYTYSAYAPEEENLKPAADVSLTVPETGVSVIISLDAALPYGFRGMPDDYEFSAEQMEAKCSLKEHDVVNALKNMTPGYDYVEGELLFLTEDPEYAALVAEAYNAELSSFESGVAVITLCDNTVEEAMEVAADPEIPMPPVDPNYLSRFPVAPSYRPVLKSSKLMSAAVPQKLEWADIGTMLTDPDPYLTNPASDEYQWMHGAVNSYAAWGVTTGAGITVAVVDTGVNAGHPDLSGKVTDMSAVTGLSAYAVVKGKSQTHGTHVAGIIGAWLDNAVGGAGIAPGVDLLSYRIMDNDGALPDALINKAIEDAGKNAKVINCSFGGTGYSTAAENVYTEAINNGAVIVVSAGNDNSNLMNYPAAYNIPGMITVAATDRDGNRASFSTYGGWVDVCAPGVGIYSTSIPDYEYMSGTSQAAPVVSGICALYRSVYPGASPAEVEAAVKAAVNKNKSSGTGTGVVDASLLFSKDTAAPQITAQLRDIQTGYIQPLYAGKSIPLNADILIKPADIENGTISENGDRTTILFTVDGKTPSILNGVANDSCIVVDGSSASIRVSDYFSSMVGKKVTLKAAYVTGMGVLSKVSSFSFTVDADLPVALEIMHKPSYLLSGKSAPISFRVQPAATASQKVVCSIVSSENCAKATISSAGVLSATLLDTSKDGSVTILAKSADPRLASGEYNTIFWQKQFTVTVKNLEPTAKIELSDTAWTFDIKSTEKTPKTVTATAKDKYGVPVLQQPSFTWTTSNAKVATVSGGKITPVAKGSATITCKALDGSGKTATVKVTVKQLVEEIVITGQFSVAPGAKATYKATVLPKDANNKKLVWSFSGSGVQTASGASVTASYSNNAPIYVSVSSADGGASASFDTVYVRPKTTKVDLYLNTKCPSHYNIGVPITGANINLYPIDDTAIEYSELGNIGTSLFYTNKAKVSAEAVGNTDTPVKWTSSKPSVAAVEEVGGSTAWVTALSAGKTTITCAAQDGSGKKATFNVQVIIPCSSVSVIPKNSDSLISFEDDGPLFARIARGKSVQCTAALGNAYGKPSVSKVDWYFWDSLTKNYWYRNDYASISSSGKLTVNKNTPVGTVITVYADATDGTPFSGSSNFIVSPLLSGLKLFSYDDRVNRYFWSTYKLPKQDGSVYLSYWSFDIVEPFERTFNYLPYGEYSFTASSSNPQVAGAKVVNDGGSCTLQVTSGTKAGTATITVKDTAGSGKSVKLKVTVNDPPPVK